MQNGSNLLKKQEEVVEEFLKLLRFSKCSIMTLKAAAANLGITDGELDLIFPCGLNEVIKFLFEKYRSELSKVVVLREDGITASVKIAIIRSFNILLPYKLEVKKIIKYISLSSNVILLPSFSAKIADTIWKGLNINDTGFAFYTKRLTLAGIYSNVFTFFLLTDNFEKLEKLIDLELKGLANITKAVRPILDFLKFKKNV